MNRTRTSLASLAELGPERLWFLGILTGGHFVIHWFQQFFPVVLPSIKVGLGLTNVQVGALTSAQQLVVGVSQLPLGMLADTMVRHRAKILALSLVSMGAGYFLLGTPVYALALVGSGLIGLGTALWHPTAAGSLSNRFPERRATALSIHGTGATLSDTITPFCVGFLLAAIPWHTATQMQFVPGVLLGFVLWRALAGLFRDADAAPRRAGTQFRDVALLMKNTAFLGVSAATGLLQMGRLVTLTFLPIYLQEHLQYSSVTLGFYIALLHVMGTASQPVLGVLSDRFGRAPTLVAGWLLYAIVYACFAVATDAWHAWALFAVYGIFFGLTEGTERALIADVVPLARRGTAYGWYYLAVGLGTFPASLIFGLLWTRLGAPVAFFTGASLALIASVGIVFAIRASPSHQSS